MSDPRSFFEKIRDKIVGTVYVEDVFEAEQQLDSGAKRVLLYYSYTDGDAEKLKILVNRGFDINKIDANGDALIHHAAAQGHKEIVELLIGRGADIEIAQSKRGYKALHIAAYHGQKEMVELLLSCRADIDARHCKKGYTALHPAAEKGHKEIVELLLDRGADVNAKDNDGETAADYGIQYPEIVKLLEDAAKNKRT